MYKKSFLLALSLLILALTGCPTTTQGGGEGGTGSTISDKGVIEGQVTMQDGTAAANTILHLEKLVEGRTASINRAITNRGDSRLSPVTPEPPSSIQVDYWWQTDEQGKYRITGISPGLYSIKAVLADTLGAGYSNIAIEAGSTTVQNITLTATGTISGKVTQDGKITTLPGTVVYTAGLSYKAFPAPDGSFRIEGVPVGSYEIHFSHDNYVTVVEQNVVVAAKQDTVLAAKTLFMEPLRIVECSKPDGAVHASLKRYIEFHFNKIIDPASLVGASIRLFKGTEEVLLAQPEVTENKVTVRINDYLSYNTNYTLKFNGIRAIEGNKLPTEQIISFTTHSGPPQIVKATPAKDSKNLSADTLFTFQFDREMNPDTFTINSIMLFRGNTSSNNVAFTLFYNLANKTLTITPLLPLQEGRHFHLKLFFDEIKDINGIALDDTPKGLTYSQGSLEYYTVAKDITSQANNFIEVILTSQEAQRFSFDVVAGKTYEIVMDDLTDGSGKYSLDAEIDSYDINTPSHFYSSGQDSAYSTPIVFTAQKTEKYGFYVENKDGSTGKCAVLYREVIK